MPVTNRDSKQIFLGIDPGLADTGWGIITNNNGQLNSISYGSIKTPKTMRLSERLKEIEQELNKIIKKYKPNRAAIEKLFFCRNVTTAMKVGQARGVVLLALAKGKIPTTELTPLQVKQGVTGYGQADKRQVQTMVKTILDLKEIPKPDDAADALAIAICSTNHQTLTPDSEI